MSCLSAAQRLQQTFREVETLMAAMEMYGRALEQAEQRIKTLEDTIRQLDLRRPTRNGTTR